MDEKLEILIEQVGHLTEGLTEIKLMIREQAETAKQQAETARQQAETARQQAETVKQQTETMKQQAEAARIQADNVAQLIACINPPSRAASTLT